jgi:hypothetical protein
MRHIVKTRMERSTTHRPLRRMRRIRQGVIGGARAHPDGLSEFKRRRIGVERLARAADVITSVA